MSKSPLLCRALLECGICLILASSVQAAELDAAKPLMHRNPRSAGADQCFVRLADSGPVLGVPKQFWSSNTCGTTDRPVTQEWFNFDIKYPEMIPGAWTGGMERYLEHDLGPGVPLINYSAKIVWIFYADGDRRTTSDSSSGPEPEVWQQVENATNLAHITNGYPSPRIDQSDVKGLRRIRFGDQMLPSPAALERLKAQGWTPAKDEGSLVAMPNADYELLADCDQVFACKGSVLLKQDHIQYRFFIPIRAKPSMADFIESMNKLVRFWIRK